MAVVLAEATSVFGKCSGLECLLGGEGTQTWVMRNGKFADLQSCFDRSVR